MTTPPTVLRAALKLTPHDCLSSSILATITQVDLEIDRPGSRVRMLADLAGLRSLGQYDRRQSIAA